MDEHITAGEFALLLAVFWLPVFVLAAVPQWYFLAARRYRFARLLMAMLFECALAMGIWASPLYRYFLDLDFLGPLAIGSIPMQAALLACAATTVLLWMLTRRNPRSTGSP